MKKLETALFFIVLTSSSFCQQILTMDVAIELAMKNNRNITIAKNNTKSAALRVNPGNAGKMPSVTLNTGVSGGISQASETYASGDTYTRNAARSMNMNSSLNISYTIFDGFEANRQMKWLRKDLEIQYLKEREKREQTVMEVINTYLETLQSQQNKRAYFELVQLSHRRVEITRKQIENGIAKKLDLLNALVDLGRDSSEMIKAKLKFQQQREILAFLINTNNTDFILDPRIGLIETITYESIRSSTVHNNVALMKKMMENEQAMISQKITQSAWLPRISANARYGYSRSDNDVNALLFSERNSVGGSLNMSYNIFTGNKRRANTQRAELASENAQIAFEDQHKLIERQLSYAYQSFEVEKQLIEIENTNVKKAQENLALSEKSFELGLTDQLNLRKAQIELLRSQGRILQSQINAKKAEARLMQISGLLLRKDRLKSNTIN